MLELCGFELGLCDIFLLNQSISDLLVINISAIEGVPLFFDSIAHALDRVHFPVDVVEQPGDLVVALQRDESAVVAHALIVVDENVELVSILRFQVDGIDQLQDGSFQPAQLARL